MELAADVAEFVFEERGDAGLVQDVGRQVGAAHRVDRRQADEFGEEFGEWQHEPIIAVAPFRVNLAPAAITARTEFSTGTAA